MSDTLSEQRITYTRGQRAGLELLLRDGRLEGYGRAVVQDHFDRCQALLDGLVADAEEGER